MRSAAILTSSKSFRLLLNLFLVVALASASSSVAAAGAVLDFDGDGRTDYTIVRRTNDLMFWYILQGNNASRTQQFGRHTDTTLTDGAVPEDYDGDGKTDIAVFRRGDPLVLYVLGSLTGTVQTTSFSGYISLHQTQDFDGDGKADPAQAFNEPGNQNMIWRIHESQSGNLRVLHFGNFQTDRAIKGDFDGDGKADVAVYRGATGTPANTFFILNSSDGAIQAKTFGNGQTDRIIHADFDGDGKTDFAVRRDYGTGTSGVWYWIESSTGEFRSLAFGFGNIDLATPGDYDGDGKTDQAVMRSAPEGHIFYVNQSTGGITATRWGAGLDYPLAALFALAN